MSESNLGYELGRLYAVIKHANESLPPRTFEVCMHSPRMYLVYNLVELLKNMDNLDKNYRRFIEDQLTQICDNIPADDFPKSLRTKDKGGYVLGYHSQRKWMRENYN